MSRLGKAVTIFSLSPTVKKVKREGGKERKKIVCRSKKWEMRKIIREEK